MNFKDVTYPFLSTSLGKIMSVLLALVFIGSVGLDQVTKRHAHGTLLFWENPENIRQFKSKSVEVFTVGDTSPDGQFFSMRFSYQRNTGAAFSMLADIRDELRVPFFYGVTFLAILFISYYLKTLPLNYHITRLGLVLMLSGAIGNFLDRLTIGYVIDFLDTEWRIMGWHVDFAVFNIADVAINLGIICFIIEAILPKKALELDFYGKPLLKTKEKKA